MNAAEIVKTLEGLGLESYKRTMLRHGVNEPLFGVKIEELKKILKQTRKDHDLALELYDTGIYDAQYLAGLMADEKKATPAQLREWLAKSNCGAISASAVAWLAAESARGWELAREWIEAPDEETAKTGWNVLSGIVALREDRDLDVATLRQLLERVEASIHEQPNRVRYAMNNFVISAGTYVEALTERALAAGEKIGRVSVDMGDTACQVPHSPDYIRKARARGAKKRKSVRC
jgi:3-methyladenine DNA glycosylase AlkD